jgi:glycine dehydrogenase subunit 1
VQASTTTTSRLLSNTSSAATNSTPPIRPYQAEASQGTLQATFEYQSLICDLTGMEVSNASLYDGASALAEAVLMAHSINGRRKVILPKTLHPHWRQVVRTYASGMKLEFVEAPYLSDEGVTDPEFVRAHCDDSTCCVVVQHPNFFGCLERVRRIGKHCPPSWSAFHRRL